MASGGQVGGSDETDHVMRASSKANECQNASPRFQDRSAESFPSANGSRDSLQRGERLADA